MATAPNLEGSIAALLLRVARLEDQLRQMDLPFVEDRLDNMETVVASLQRTIDTLSERFEVLLTLARGLEASNLLTSRSVRGPFGFLSTKCCARKLIMLSLTRLFLTRVF